MLDRIDSGVHGNSKSCPAHTQQLAAFHSIAAVTSSETPLPQAAERPSTPPPPGRYSHDERDVEAQRKRYFDQGKPRKSSRFVITPDLNGLETFDSLNLLLSGNKTVEESWTKEEVFKTLGLIYRRVEQFLETIRSEGYTSPYIHWKVKLEKKSLKELEKSAWWKATPYKAPEVECSRIKQQNLLSYAPGGWTSQLRIVLECAQKVGPETIALGGVRKHWRSVNGTGFPELRRKNGEAISLKIRTPGLHSNEAYVDEWRSKDDDHFEIRRPGATKAMKTSFEWSWGIHDPFSVRRRQYPGIPAHVSPFVSFDTSFRKSSKMISFSQPYSIEVTFKELEEDRIARRSRFRRHGIVD